MERKTRTVKVKILYGDYCKQKCSTKICFVRSHQDQVFSATLTEGPEDVDGNCRYWPGGHVPTAHESVTITIDDRNHTLGPIRYEIIEHTKVKPEATKEPIKRLNQNDFNDMLKSLI